MTNNIVITEIEALLPFEPKISNNNYHVKNMNEVKISFENSNKNSLGIDNREITQNFSKREIKKQDRYSLLGQLIINRLLTKRQINIDESNCYDIGIIVGNNLGGWTYVEQQLIDMYREGLNKIKPYVATSWFPTALQGEVSINRNIKGYSKTICADKLSSGLALKHSVQMIKDNTCSHIITGAVESPNTPLVFNSISNPGKYLCESGIFMVVEDMNNSEKPIAEIIDYKCGNNIESIIKNLSNKEHIDYLINYNLDDETNKKMKSVSNSNITQFNFNDDLDLCSVSSIYAIYLSLKYFEQTESKVLLINTTDDNGQYFSIILKTI